MANLPTVYHRKEKKGVHQPLSTTLRTHSLNAPKSGAPGSKSLTDGRANRDVNVTPRRSVPDNMNPRRMISTSHVRTKMKKVDVQFTTKESTAANLTIGGRLAVISMFYSGVYPTIRGGKEREEKGMSTRLH
jgi:hypothetical protein